MSLREGAILGFGHVAAHGHVTAWRARPDARIVAVADIDPARRALARGLLPDARVYDSAAALLARERIDFVDIATPPGGHAELILQAMHAGCDVLCEKPLVTTVDDFHRLARWARRANLALVTVHNWKHSVQFNRLADLIAGGAVGWPTRIHLETERNGKAATVGKSWRADAVQAGGGILFDHGWHGLYLALALGRERPQRIHAVIERRRPNGGDVEDTARCRIELPSSTVELQLTWAAEQRRTRWRVTGASGSITLEDDRLQTRTTQCTHDIRFPDSISASSYHPDWFDAVIDDFFHAIDDPAARYLNLAEAEWCLTLITLAYQSAATGKALPIPTSMPALTWVHRPRPAKPSTVEGAASAAPQR
jgi:predicted dehydrogenase